MDEKKFTEGQHFRWDKIVRGLKIFGGPKFRSVNLFGLKLWGFCQHFWFKTLGVKIYRI